MKQDYPYRDISGFIVNSFKPGESVSIPMLVEATGYSRETVMIRLAKMEGRGLLIIRHGAAARLATDPLYLEEHF